MVVFDRITRASNWYGATQAEACDISKAFDSVWRAGLLHKLESDEISGWLLLALFQLNRWFRGALDAKSLQEY